MKGAWRVINKTFLSRRKNTPVHLEELGKLLGGGKLSISLAIAVSLTKFKSKLAWKLSKGVKPYDKQEEKQEGWLCWSDGTVRASVYKHTHEPQSKSSSSVFLRRMLAGK